MSFTPSNSIQNTSLILDLIAQRQRALSGNLANMDTPGYVRKDINFSQYLGTMNNPLETELSAKLGPSAIIQDTGGEVNPSDELAEMQKNALLYTVATRRMTNIITELRTVVNVGK